MAPSIAQFTRAELADWFGYVPQECTLFAGTIRDNIAHGGPDAGDEEVIRAATLAGVHQITTRRRSGRPAASCRQDSGNVSR